MPVRSFSEKIRKQMIVTVQAGDVYKRQIYSICRSALGLKACNDGKLTFLKKNCLKDQELPSDACGGVCEENPMYKLTRAGIDVKPEKREAGQGRQVRDFSDFTEAVSYTHLDVYKRQVLRSI